ncbi:MAG: hypothetical protein GX446_00425 [Chthonomonadales bacterium]|nr:hypothetical protein [Chthonomonadales bacterium]
MLKWIARELMVSSRLGRICVATLGILCGTASSALGDPPDLSRDIRLHRHVTLTGEGLYLAEVASALSRQTGVSVVADESSGASDARLLIRVTQLPAWQVMEALSSVFSYKHAPWQWEVKMGTVPAYRLVQSRSAQELPSRLERAAQDEFERMTEEAIASSPWTLEERERRMSMQDPMTVQERATWGLQLFAECLTQEDRLAVIRGHSRPTIKVTDLPGWGRRFVEDMYRGHDAKRKLPDGSFEPVPRPEWIRFAADRLGNKATRSLYIDVDGLGGYAYSGGVPLQRRFNELHLDMWLLDGDARSHKGAEARIIPERKPNYVTRSLTGLARRCAEISEHGDIPLIARVPRVRSFLDAGSGPVGRVLGPYLSDLRDTYQAAHKWRHGILLVTYSSWFCQPEEVARPPWSQVKAIREAVKANDRTAMIEALLRAASVMTLQQLRVLEADWHAAGSLAVFQTPLATVHRDADLRHTLVNKGEVRVRLASDRLAADRSARSILPEGTSSVQITRVEELDGEERLTAVNLRALAEDGRQLLWHRLVLRPQESP